MERIKARVRAAKQNNAKMRKSDLLRPKFDDAIGAILIFALLFAFLHLN